jgi:MFS family permease
VPSTAANRSRATPPGSPPGRAEDAAIPQREIRRSFAFGIVNGAMFSLAETLIDPPLVLTWFVSRLTTSNLLIGLVSPLGDAGWFLPQVLLAPALQKMRRKMPMYVLGAITRVSAWAALVVAVWLVRDPFWLLAVFYALYALARLTACLSGIPFFDIVAKAIPARRRGSFFAWRQLVGGVLSLGGGWVVKAVLNHPGLHFPTAHALLFTLYTLALAISLASFIGVREPPGIASDGRLTLASQLRRALQLVRENGTYRRYIAAQVCLALGGIALPFYGLYAKVALGAPEGMVGIYVAVRSAAALVANLPWGRLSDRHGNRLVLRVMSAGSGLTVLTALGLVALMGVLPWSGPWLPYLALPLFILDGAVRPAGMIAGNNFLIELVPEAERPLYLGFFNTLMGIAVLVSGLGGLLVDAFGFSGLFAASLALHVVGFLLAGGLPEPRAARAV